MPGCGSRALLLVVACAGSASASPADMFGFGARNQALAGSGTAHAEGYSASYQNPARLSIEPQRQLAFGAQAAHFGLQASGLPSSEDQPAAPPTFDDDSQAAVMGLVLPLLLGQPLDDRLALGLGASSPGSTIVRVRIFDPERPQFPLLGPRAETLNFNLGLGLRLPWGLSVGTGSMFLASLIGEIAINAGASGRVSSVTDDELVIVQAPLIGINWQPTEKLSLGLVWRSELRSEFDLQVRVQDLGQVIVPPLNITGLAQADPAQLQGELAYRSASWLFATGATYKLWSNFERFKEATVLCPPEQPDCDAPPAPRLRLHDTLVARVALERSFALTETAQGHLRAGYFYAPSPLQAQVDTTNLFDNDRHALTLGYGVSIERELAVHFAAQHQWLAPRTHRKPRGAVETSGRIWSYALDLELQF